MTIKTCRLDLSVLHKGHLKEGLFNENVEFQEVHQHSP